MGLANHTEPRKIEVSGPCIRVQARITTDAAAPGKVVELTAAPGFPTADAEIGSVAVVNAAADIPYGILDVNLQTGGDKDDTYSQNEVASVIIPQSGFLFWGKKASGAIAERTRCGVSDSGDFESDNTGAYLSEYAAASDDTHVLLRFLPGIS